MDDVLHDAERAADVARHTIIGLKRRISAQLDGSDLHLILGELIELSRMLEDVSQLRNKAFSGTPKENLDILRAIYQDIRVVLKRFEDVREICPNIEDDRPNVPQHHSNPELSADRRSRRPLKERITLIHRQLRERRLSLLSKLVVLNTVRIIETYPNEDLSSQTPKTLYHSQQLVHSSPAINAGQSEDALDEPDRSEEKSISHQFENEKYLSSEMFPMFKHMRQETLQTMPSKSSTVVDARRTFNTSSRLSQRSPTARPSTNEERARFRSKDSPGSAPQCAAHDAGAVATLTGLSPI